MENQITITWHISDVKEVAKDIEVTLTNDEAREILHSLKRNHDACVGINWDVIADAVGVYKDSYRLGDTSLS